MKKEFCKIDLTMTKEDHRGEIDYECFGPVSFMATNADVAVVIANVIKALEIDSGSFLRMAHVISLHMKSMKKEELMYGIE